MLRPGNALSAARFRSRAGTALLRGDTASRNAPLSLQRGVLGMPPSGPKRRRWAMSIYITQGRYTREAIKGMIVKPEDRAEALSRHMARAGGRVLNYYLTFGEYDFLTIIEAPSETQMAAALIAAAGAGGVTDLRTTLALTSIEAKGVFAAASDLAPSYRSPGGA
jgi:uncharacterized protein with GYD domain